VSTTRTKAVYQKPGFTGGGWRGPSVVVKFTSSAPPVDVYRFVGARAKAVPDAAAWTCHRGMTVAFSRAPCGT